MIAATEATAGSPLRRDATGRKRRGAHRRAIAILAAAGAVVAAVAVAAGGWWGGLRLNLTPSEPLGLWRIVPLGRPPRVGDLVFVCPPPGPVSRFGLERGYFRAGLCPGGAAPLIKSIAAVAGARITIGIEVTVDAAPLSHSRLSPRDGAGRPLLPWPGGVVSPGQIVLHSPFAGSYDSRYFGPIPEAGLLGLARPLLTIVP